MLLLVRLAISVIATTLAALTAERALRDLGRHGRFVWAAALVLSGATSVLLVTGGSLPLDAPASVAAWLAPAPLPLPAAGSPLAAPGATFDPLPYAWLVFSLGTCALLGMALLRQRARLRAARSERVCGVDVLVTRALGPAVMGFLHPRIVLPDWLLDRPDEERRLVVEHEAEHIAARDPLLAALGLAVVCVVPWNPLLWYQLRRLRLAIELDCDARVLRRGDARAYGRLLVDVADRLARGTPLATALAFPRNFLEWRIRMITNRRTRPLRAAAWSLAAGALVVAACADAADPADPVSTDVQASSTVEALTERIDLGPERYKADSIALEAEGNRVVLRQLASPDGGFERTANPALLPPRADATDVPGLVRFSATLNPDDTPAAIEIDETVPAETQQRIREEMSTHRFRRSQADPDAPVQGIIAVP